MDRLRVIILALFTSACTVVGLVCLLLVAAFGSIERAHRSMIGLDQAGNALTGGSEDETISSRGGRGIAEGRAHWCVICWVIGLMFLDRDHCKNSRGE